MPYSRRELHNVLVLSLEQAREYVVSIAGGLQTGPRLGRAVVSALDGRGVADAVGLDGGLANGRFLTVLIMKSSAA